MPSKKTPDVKKALKKEKKKPPTKEEEIHQAPISDFDDSVNVCSWQPCHQGLTGMAQVAS